MCILSDTIIVRGNFTHVPHDTLCCVCIKCHFWVNPAAPAGRTPPIFNWAISNQHKSSFSFATINAPTRSFNLLCIERSM